MAFFNFKKKQTDKPSSVSSFYNEQPCHLSSPKFTLRIKPSTLQDQPIKSQALVYMMFQPIRFTLPSNVTTEAVRSYRTFSPLPCKQSGIFSAALSVHITKNMSFPLGSMVIYAARTFLPQEY